MRAIKFRVWSEKYKRYVGETTRFNIDSTDRLPITVLTVDYSRIIEQFTGLTDKNGKEIYEGDIIKNKFRERYQTLVCYWNEIKNGFSFRDQFDGYDRSITSCEVIGNIHENPELLK